MAPKRDYTKEQMNRAIDEVQRGEKVSVAAAKYGVPRITLRNKVKGISPLDCCLGPSTVLSQEEEKLLVQWVFYMAESHYPVTRDHLLDSVQKIILEKNLENCPFTNNRPGKKWFSSFLKRHPDLAQRTAQNLSKAREDVSEEELNKWFETIKTYLEGKGLSEALKDPTRIYNTDESAFYLQPKAGRVLVRKGEKNVYSSSGDEKENLTVLLTANAAGVMAPPLIVYPYERIPTLIVKSVPSGWGIGRSETGWMCARTFFEFMTNIFNPWLIAKEIQKPVIFFMDGHKSHMSLHLANFCRDNDIELIALFPNSTHLIQPMDVAVFRPLKLSWRVQVMNWKTENKGARLKKDDFAPNLQEALKGLSPETIKNGFRKSGLHPFGSEYVDMSKIASGNRTVRADNQQHHTEDVLEKTKFIKYLENEIQEVFSLEKLTLFNKLYFMSRSEVDNVLSDEDQNLYIIWAKTKSILTETIDISTSNDNMMCQLEQSRANEGPALTTSMLSKDLPQKTDLRQASPFRHELPFQTTESEFGQPKSTLSKSLPTIDIGSDEIATTTEPVASSTLKTIDTYKYSQITTVALISENDELPSPNEQALTHHELSDDNNETEPSQSTSALSKSVTPTNIGPDGIVNKTKPVIFSTNQTFKSSQTGELGKLPLRGEPASMHRQVPGDNLQAGSNQSTSTFTKNYDDMLPARDGSNSVTTTITTVLCTPVKTNLTSKLSTSTTTTIGIVPSPFKRALFWPEPENKKRRIKERLPSAITSDPYINYVEKKENEKKQKIEEKEKRAIERKEKQLLREKIKQEKKINTKSKKGKAKTKTAKSKKKQISSSSSEECNTDVEYQDSEYDLEEDLYKSESEEDLPLKTLALLQMKDKKSKYVIIKYEGEYFPGIIKNVEDKQFEISTMVLAKGNTFRWPEIADQIWYDEKSTVEYIKDPLPINKRGFYKVDEMKKYLPFIL